MEGQLVNVQKMAEILGVPVSWLYRRTSEGRIPFLKLGKYIRFEPSTVISSLKQ